MYYPVIVVLDGANDCAHAYEGVVAAMRPYTYNDWIGLSFEAFEPVDGAVVRPLADAPLSAEAQIVERAARCDGWILGGRAPGALRLRVPELVAVLGGLLEPLPAGADASEVRAIVGAPPPGAASDGAIDMPCSASDAKATFTRTASADLARVGDLDRSSLTEVYAEQPCLVVGGVWFEMDEYTPSGLVERGWAILSALPDRAWVGVLSAHV